MATAGTSSPVTVPAGLIGMGTATTTLGAAVAGSAVAIGAAGGGIGALNKLRKDILTELNKSCNNVLLRYSDINKIDKSIVYGVMGSTLYIVKTSRTLPHI